MIMAVGISQIFGTFWDHRMAMGHEFDGDGMKRPAIAFDL
jgi:hypothetical protein